MFDKPTKKLIIVGNKDTDVYCEFLSLLVSTKDDVTVEKEDGTKEKTIFAIEDDSVDTAIWTDDIYRDNRAHTSSRQKTLFIGDKGCVESVIPNLDLETKDSEFGVYMGWLGNKAVIYVDEDKAKKSNKYNKFYEEYKKETDMYNARIKIGSNDTQAKTSAKEYFDQYVSFFKKKEGKAVGVAGAVAAAKTATAVTIGAVGGIVGIVGSAAIKITSDVHKNNNLIVDQLYRYAILKFYMNHLADFMEMPKPKQDNKSKEDAAK